MSDETTLLTDVVFNTMPIDPGWGVKSFRALA